MTKKYDKHQCVSLCNFYLCTEILSKLRKDVAESLGLSECEFIMEMYEYAKVFESLCVIDYENNDFINSTIFKMTIDDLAFWLWSEILITGELPDKTYFAGVVKSKIN